MRRLLTIPLCVAIIFFCHGQNDDPFYEYRHMTGNLGPYELICDFLITGNEITGNTYSPGRVDNNSNQDDANYGFRLQGLIDEYGIAEIEAFEANQISGIFSGSMGLPFQGTFRPTGSEMIRSFLLEEDYTESVAFDGFTIERDSSLLDSLGSPEARINISVLLPRDAETYSFIREAVLEAYFGKQQLSGHPDPGILPAFASIYFARYIESNIDIFDGGYSFNWEMQATAYINLNRNGLLVYRTENYAYTGGAHGMGASRFLVFDLLEKTQLSLEDIFVDNYERELSTLLEKKYREQMFLSEDESLADNGLFEEEIHPSQNFWLTDESIGFFYNPYHLAPYSMGPISISLHKDVIHDLLKPDAPVKRLGW